LLPRYHCRLRPQGKRDGSTRDEPFAWESREFLRSKLIGQVGDARQAQQLRRGEAAALPNTRAVPRASRSHAWPAHPACLALLPLPCDVAAPAHHTQPCVFRVDYTVDVAGGPKEFGSVFLQDEKQHKENVALSVVQNGWAKVRAGAGAVAATRPQPRAGDACVLALTAWGPAPGCRAVCMHTPLHSRPSFIRVRRCASPRAPTPSRAPSSRS
jgi:hypothetical protein